MVSSVTYRCALLVIGHDTNSNISPPQTSVKNVSLFLRHAIYIFSSIKQTYKKHFKECSLSLLSIYYGMPLRSKVILCVTALAFTSNLIIQTKIQ